jgi:hypothetical protein
MPFVNPIKLIKDHSGSEIPPHNINHLDEGVRNTVLLLNEGGFQTFTSCEGGRGHAFQHETIGIDLNGPFSAFEKRLIRFLRSHGMTQFSISLMTDYSAEQPKGKRMVYLSGLDILSERKRKQVLESMRRKERRLRKKLRES